MSAFGLSESSHAAVNPAKSAIPGEQIRRLDWRFLLPTPELRRVFFVGPARSPLLDALRACGCDMVTSPPAHGTGSPDRMAERFDVCVVQSMNEADVAQAARFVAPGGWVYWEITVRSPLVAPWRYLATRRHTDQRRLQSLSRCRRLLARSGLSRLRRSWHYPDFDSCRRIVPLEGAAGVRYFSRTGPALLRPIGEWLGTRILASGVLPRLGASVSFVAQKPFAAVEVRS